MIDAQRRTQGKEHSAVTLNEKSIGYMVLTLHVIYWDTSSLHPYQHGF